MPRVWPKVPQQQIGFDMEVEQKKRQKKDRSSMLTEPTSNPPEKKSLAPVSTPSMGMIREIMAPTEERPLKDIMLLALLTLDLETVKCTACPLYKDRIHPVPGQYKADNLPYIDTVMVGEAPGSHEDEESVPFVGPAGQILHEVMSLAQIDESRIYITNVVKCRPVINNGIYIANRTPTPEEVTACSQYLKRELAILQPRIIVLIGSTSLNHFISGKKIISASGIPIQSGAKVYLPVIHPAATMHGRNPLLREKLETSIMKLKELMKETANAAE